MRAALILTLILGLTACAPPAPPDPFAPIAATPEDAVPEASAPTDAPLADAPPAEAAPPETPPPETTSPEPPPAAPAPQAAPEPPPEPPALANQRQECRRSGGQLAPRLPGVYACVRATRDAGRRCEAAADCEGLCLARSASCAPLAPLFGCHEVFTSPGRRETLCTD